MPAKASRDLWNVNTPRGPKYTIQWQLHVNKTYLICSCVINIELYVCVSLFCNVAKFGTEERKGTEIWPGCAEMVTDSFVLCGVSVYFFHPCFCWLGHHVALKFWGGDGVLTAITFFVLLSPFLLIYQKFSLLNPSPTSSVVNFSFFVGYFSFLHLQRSLLYPRVFNTPSPCERRRHSSQVYNKWHSALLLTAKRTGSRIVS